MRIAGRERGAHNNLQARIIRYYCTDPSATAEMILSVESSSGVSPYSNSAKSRCYTNVLHSNANKHGKNHGGPCEPPKLRYCYIELDIRIGFGLFREPAQLLFTTVHNHRCSSRPCHNTVHSSSADLRIPLQYIMAPAAPSLPTRFPCWVRATYSWGGEVCF